MARRMRVKCLECGGRRMEAVCLGEFHTIAACPVCKGAGVVDGFQMEPVDKVMLPDGRYYWNYKFRFHEDDAPNDVAPKASS